MADVVENAVIETAAASTPSLPWKNVVGCMHFNTPISVFYRYLYHVTIRLARWVQPRHGGAFWRRRWLLYRFREVSKGLSGTWIVVTDVWGSLFAFINAHDGRTSQCVLSPKQWFEAWECPNLELSNWDWGWGERLIDFNIRPAKNT